MGAGRWDGPWRLRAGLVAGLLAVIGLVAAVASMDDGPDLDTTAAEDASTSTSSTSTTERPTTTTEEPETTTSAAPETTEPPALTPATQAAPPTPPPTAPAPPPSAPTTAAPSRPFDMPSVLAFAKGQHRVGSPPLYSHPEPLCPAHQPRPSDAGDHPGRDIEMWHLDRTCSGTLRVVMSTTNDHALHAAWVRIDRTAGGCEGTDEVAIAWWEPAVQSVDPRAAVIATPTCDPASWGWRAEAAYPMWNGHWIEMSFSAAAIGDPASFSWRGYVQTVGMGAPDVVPNAGPEHFAR